MNIVKYPQIAIILSLQCKVHGVYSVSSAAFVLLRRNEFPFENMFS